jgi:hypothetical protein
MKRYLKILFCTFVLATIVIGFLRIVPTDLYGSTRNACPPPTANCRVELSECKLPGPSAACRCKYVSYWLNCEVAPMR